MFSSKRIVRARGFSRIELVVVLAATALLGVMLVPFLSKSRVKGQASSCVANMKKIGEAMAIYSRENAGKLPYAYILYTNERQTSWDTLLGARLGTPKPEPPPKNGIRVNVAPVPEALHCPTDTLAPASWAEKYQLKRRSYSMTRHDMLPQNWPPKFDNATGAGLWWTFGAKGDRPPAERIYNHGATNQQAAVTMSMLLMPKNIMLVTEQISSHNIAANGSRSFITRTLDHCETNGIAPDLLHGGRFNYLLADGHVESLFPEETVGPNGKAGQHVSAHQGIWTIRVDD
ncbi:MAG: prepilin-type N-terminal cleavage/methylation domain-containing protein [Verrucomicrobiota bacterium]